MDRAFAMSPTHGRASGAGVERETLVIAFDSFPRAAFWRTISRDYLVPQVLYPDMPIAAIPPRRLIDMQALGAVCGLMVVNGQLPDKLSPFVIQYLIHRGNLDALRPSFVNEWNPELATDLKEWMRTDPAERDLTRFLQLFTTTIGVPLGRAFEGGSETLVSVLSTCAIRDADSVLPFLDVHCPEGFSDYLNTLRVLVGNPLLTFYSIFDSFLRAVGAPCPTRFAELTGAFHPSVDLDLINTPAFRPRVFVWALTGNPFINTAVGPDSRLEIFPARSTDSEYAPTNGHAHQAAAGTIQWCTCFSTGRFPIEYLLDLARAHYDGSTEPASFQEACDFWIMQQCCSVIGRHNML
uniref:Uncharacterized protein n=1 Tax=Mycena chlorophos TaxID=658473 RepID=A0ABQ0KWC5_MYCCL|nr:predicted protein [Mycena chlorophos]